MKLFRFILLLFLVLSLVSCSTDDRSTDDILDEMVSVLPSLPSGTVYRSSAQEGDEDFMSGSLAKAMYGEGADKMFSTVEEYSVYLSSFAEPYEIAVFKCYSRTDAHGVLAMCLTRRDILQISLRGSAFYELCDDIRIISRGRYVIMCLTDSPDLCERTAHSLIG